MYLFIYLFLFFLLEDEQILSVEVFVKSKEVNTFNILHT